MDILVAWSVGTLALDALAVMIWTIWIVWHRLHGGS